MKLRAWISAMRLRTLPLALSCIIMGSAMAYSEGQFDVDVLIWAMLTTLFLQILSNLANDYGDGVKGTDNAERIGPKRAIQSGILSVKEMRWGIILTSLLALLSGVQLLRIGLGELSISFWIFFALGILSIAAAIKYTVGKTAYGYRGLGDLFVFLFFGWVGVVGTNFLHTGSLDPWLLLPATSVGLFAVGVLNLNNMRDHENDAQSNKRTMVVWMGFNKAKLYHLSLISVGWMTMLIFAAYHFRDTWHYLFLLALPIFVLNVRWVLTTSTPAQLDGELKKVALGTFLFTVLIAIGQWIAF